MTGMRFDEHVDTLKRELRNAIATPLRLFEERTGVSPRDLRLEMVETTTAGSRHRTFTIANVRVEFDL
jgi:hypothetical protein